MNPLVKAQLDKLRGIQVYSEDDSLHTLKIPKQSTELTVLKQGSCYLISLEDYILNPPDGFTLHTNWNKNKIPKHKVMKIDVLQIMGKMIKVNSIGYDMVAQRDVADVWEGWLPEKSITIIERL